VTRSLTSNFAGGAGLTAVVAGGVLAFATRGAAADSRWALAGFLAMALPIIAAGAWLAHQQGRAGVSFVVALGTGLSLRAVLLAVVVATAARQGRPALEGAIAGLALGFVPMTVYEMVWFARRVHGAGELARWRS